MFSHCLSFFRLWEVMADRGKGESSKTTDFRGSDVEEVELLNVSFTEMELGKDIDVTTLFMNIYKHKFEDCIIIYKEFIVFAGQESA